MDAHRHRRDRCRGDARRRRTRNRCRGGARAHRHGDDISVCWYLDWTRGVILAANLDGREGAAGVALAAWWRRRFRLSTTAPPHHAYAVPRRQYPILSRRCIGRVYSVGYPVLSATVFLRETTWLAMPVRLFPSSRLDLMKFSCWMLCHVSVLRRLPQPLLPYMYSRA